MAPATRVHNSQTCIHNHTGAAVRLCYCIRHSNHAPLHRNTATADSNRLLSMVIDKTRILLIITDNSGRGVPLAQSHKVNYSTRRIMHFVLQTADSRWEVGTPAAYSGHSGFILGAIVPPTFKLSLFVTSSVRKGKWWVTPWNQATTTSLHILSNSLFTNPPACTHREHSYVNHEHKTHASGVQSTDSGSLVQHTSTLLASILSFGRTLATNRRPNATDPGTKGRCSLVHLDPVITTSVYTTPRL
jgi:hypothetical protein